VGRVVEVSLEFGRLKMIFIRSWVLWVLFFFNYHEYINVFQVAQKRWKLEINFSQDAVLMLSSMNLPDGLQVSTLSLLCFF
jgi:exosome complex component RRP4